MSDGGEQKPKPQILVDDDWKSQAQAEKEKMAQAEAAKAAQGDPVAGAAGAGATGAAGGAGSAGSQKLPPADFSSLVGMLVTQAIMYLGGVSDKQSGGVVFDPDLSRFYIDLLSVLQLQQAAFADRSTVLTVNRLELEQYVDLNLALGGSWER